MNILICFSHPWNGARAYGAEMQTSSLAQALTERGHRITLVAAKGGQNAAPPGTDVRPGYELDFQSANPLQWSRVSGQLGEIADTHRIDIVHAQHRTAGYHAEVLFRRKKIPYVVTVHDMWRSAPLKRVHGRVLRRVIAVSEFVRGSMIRDFRVPEASVRTIYNGVDASRFAPTDGERAEAFRSRFGLADHFVISVIGRLSRAKGQADLLRALPLLPADIGPFKCLIVGEGRIQGELEALATGLGVRDKILFGGYQPDIPAVIQISDMVVLPTHQESFGLVLVEAMLSRKAVIGSEVGGVPEIITHGRDGLLYRVGDTRALAESIASLARDPELRARLAQEGYRTALERFSIQRMADQTERYYSEILAR